VTSDWGARAERLLEQALDEVRNGIDAIATVDLALACLRIEDESLSAAELDGYTFPGEQVCICPAELLERGGHRGGCPVHSFSGSGSGSAT
jgi:hypothetical protein